MMKFIIFNICSSPGSFHFPYIKFSAGVLQKIASIIDDEITERQRLE